VTQRNAADVNRVGFGCSQGLDTSVHAADLRLFILFARRQDRIAWRTNREFPEERCLATNKFLQVLYSETSEDIGPAKNNLVWFFVKYY
jgi:hypothetical protein